MLGNPRHLFACVLVLCCLLLSWSPPVSADVSVLYFRGVCVAAGTPCNVTPECPAADTCLVTVAAIDDVTVVGWSTVPPPPIDLYKGLIGTGIVKGAFNPGFAAGPAFFVNVNACFMADMFGPDTGPMTQAADPNPAVGTGTYYVYSQDAGLLGLPNVNDFGCSNPGLCNNAGWCELGTSPGMPCNAAADCLGMGAICTIRATTCSIDTGPGDLGGCAAHATCVGGTNDLRLCWGAADCPMGGFCSGVPQGAVTPGQTCFLGGTAVMPSDECPLGSPLLTTRMIDAAIMAGCP